MVINRLNLSRYSRALTKHVSASCIVHQQPADMAATTALREALNKGISSGNLIDTKIILYSHRDSSARVFRPKALYTNSHVLKTVPYFNDRESTATLDTARVEPHTTVSKCSSEISRSLSQKTSKKQLMKRNLQRITVIRPVVLTKKVILSRPISRRGVQ